MRIFHSEVETSSRKPSHPKFDRVLAGASLELDSRILSSDCLLMLRKRILELIEAVGDDVCTLSKVWDMLADWWTTVAQPLNAVFNYEVSSLSRDAMSIAI